MASEPSQPIPTASATADALEGLADFARAFPNRRREVANEIAEAINAKLRDERLWLGRAEALKTAAHYLDAFEGEALGAIVAAALELLAAEDPAIGRWPLFRPALELLTSATVKRWLPGRDQVARRIVEEILRFGANDENSPAHVLFDLRRFRPEVLDDDAIRMRLVEPVTRVRRGAHEIKSSAVADDIRALLIVPHVVGPDGIEDALGGLDEILASAKTRRPSLALAHAYEPLLTLVAGRDEIAGVVADKGDWFTSKLDTLVERVADLWAAASQNPTILATFALPPRARPERVIVHNWAFASIHLAELLGRRERIDRALDEATKHPDLVGGIEAARSTRASARDSGPIDPDQLRTRDRATFYETLGQRLAQMERLDAQQQVEACKILVEQCLRFGPKELDAAVLLAAVRLDLSDHVLKDGLADYTRRMRDDRALRDALRPIVALFPTPDGDEDGGED